MPGADNRALLPGAAMRLDYGQLQALAFIGICGIVGGVLGLLVSMVRDGKGERDGAD